MLKATGKNTMAEKNLDFRTWLRLQETGTSTGDVAGFSRISIPLVRRQMTLGPWGEQDPFFNKKKRKGKSKNTA